MTTTMTERVAAGASVLDANRPGWEAEVNPKTLDLVNIWCCVLGQVFGSYMEGADSLGIERWGEEAASLGFRLPDEEERDDEPERESWSSLTDAWRELLAERLVAA